MPIVDLAGIPALGHIVFTEENNLENSVISMGNTNMLDQFEIKKDMVIMLVKSIMVDSPQCLTALIPGYWGGKTGDCGALDEDFGFFASKRCCPRRVENGQYTALFKKWSGKNLRNYRVVSLVSVLWKLFKIGFNWFVK